jgi:hypothetical protein
MKKKKGLEALTTVENFMDVWHIESNAARRPQFLSLLADAQTSSLILSLCDEGGPAGRVAMGVLNRIAQCSSAGLALVPYLSDVLKRTLAAPAGHSRLMWLEISGALLTKQKEEIPSDFVAFLKACVAAASLFGEREVEEEESIVCGELTGLLAAQILSRGGTDVSGLVLAALAKGGEEWRCEHALEGLANLLLSSSLQQNDRDIHGAAAVFRRGASRGWRACGVWMARHFKEEPKCAHCGVVGKLSVCGKCHETKYCSVKCQGEAWPKHKLTCVAKK